jgi:hypothetical protein
VNDHLRAAYFDERQTLDRLVDAAQRLADAEAHSRFLHNWPNEGFHQPATITRQNVLAELKHLGIE